MENRHTQFPSMIWWIGVVENRNDPLALGRCQVRIVSHDTPDNEDLPTEQLMWAVPVMPTNSASVSGIGLSPTGIVQGSTVIGFFVDGDRGQQPAILGTIPGSPTWTTAERQNIIDNDFLAGLKSMFNGEIEKSFESDPTDIDLRAVLRERARFEMPHIHIPPNIAYEESLLVSAPAIGAANSTEMMVFRHLFAIFASNINYLCVSPTSRIGKYQFTPNFLISQGFLNSESVFEHSEWNGQDDIYSLIDFLHAFDLQEELFVDFAQEAESGIDSESIHTTMGDLMVGMLVKEGLDNWDGETNYVDDEGRSASDAYKKGLLAAYYAENMNGE